LQSEKNMSAPMTRNLQTWERSLHSKDLVPDQGTITKVLIPYDGSENAAAALAALARMGLPPELDVLVAVTDVWLPLSPFDITRAVSARRMKVLTAGVSSFVPALRDNEEQRVLSLEAEKRISAMFPLGKIRTDGLHDGATIAHEIIRKAKTWGADLIVVGSNPSPSPHINDYAGPALKLAQGAHCSVRIARASDREGGSSVRIVIGLQEICAAAEVVQAVAARAWPAGSEAALVMGKNGPRGATRDSEVSLVLEQMAERLRAVGLKVSIAIRNGQAQDVLLKEAHSFSADCIFIDSHGHQLADGVDRLALNKVAQALILGAHCSVEVVRAKPLNDHDFKSAA
jgi:nucleotide-binding universal stress UspA family protein